MYFRKKYQTGPFRPFLTFFQYHLVSYKLSVRVLRGYCFLGVFRFLLANPIFIPIQKNGMFLTNFSLPRAEIIGLILFGILLLFPGFRALLAPPPDLETSESGRNDPLDALRGISIIGVILIHVDSYIAYYHPSDPILSFTKSLSNLSLFSVPVFVVSSGIYLSYKNPRDFFLSRFFHLILPYLIYCTTGYFTKYSPDSFLSNFGFFLITGTLFEPYYYVPLLLQLYFIYALILRNPLLNSPYARWSLPGIAFLINFLSNYFFTKGGILEAISFTNFIFFFVMGYAGKKLLKSPKSYVGFLENSGILRILGLTFILYFGYMLYYTILDRRSFSIHDLLYCPVSFYLLYYFCIQMESGWKRIFAVLKYLGKNSLFIFLGHPIFIHLQHHWDPYFFGGMEFCIPIILILNLLFPLLVGILYTRILKIFSK